MQLHWGWAVIGALALGAALAWWMQDDEGSHGSAGHAPAHALDREAGGPTLYRWVDAGGVVNITTDRPPAGTRYNIVHIDPNQNIVPMHAESSGSPASTAAH
ncbi:MAG TPA: DUF4124 domain-containing protein [Xanthomonadaceae bacterium]|jgi:hypothetical protein|nr:DUF4124 domain-containing protein [Xanthomonadaceae bacterium]